MAEYIKKNPTIELTSKQTSFALSLVANKGNVAAAVREIGINKNTGTKWSRMEAVQDFIEALGDSASDKVASSQEVLEFLTSTMRGEIKHQLVSAKTGEIVEVLDLHARNKSADLISKIYGMQRDVIDLNQQTVFEIGFDFEEDGVDEEGDIILANDKQKVEYLNSIKSYN